MASDPCEQCFLKKARLYSNRLSQSPGPLKLILENEHPTFRIYLKNGGVVGIRCIRRPGLDRTTG